VVTWLKRLYDRLTSLTHSVVGAHVFTFIPHPLTACQWVSVFVFVIPNQYPPALDVEGTGLPGNRCGLSSRCTCSNHKRDTRGTQEGHKREPRDTHDGHKRDTRGTQSLRAVVGVSMQKDTRGTQEGHCFELGECIGYCIGCFAFRTCIGSCIACFGLRTCIGSCIACFTLLMIHDDG
jgi:hypothetical protein